MHKTNRIPHRRPVIALAVCSALAAMAPAPALADPLLTVKLFRDSDVMFRDSDMSRYAENYVELGAGYNSNDSFKFGQFSGLTEKGAFGIAGFNWQQRNEANDARYWRIFGANLGLDSRKFLFETGQQGAWGLTFGADQLKRSEIDSASFVHLGLGSNALTLPAGYTKASVADPTDTDLLTQAPLHRFDIEQGRDIYRFGVSGAISPEWGIKINYREDRRDGTRLTGLLLGTRNNVALVVPYAINDRTQQLDTVLAYASKDLQWQIGYSLSRFKNSETALEVQNPFNTNAVVSFGRMSLNPDNDFHQVQTTAAYNISRKTRVTAQLMYGVATQNEAFLPYTTDTTALTYAMPRTSLDGKVVHTQADLALITQPIDKMNLKLAYQYRDNDNRTPVAEYFYPGRDVAQPATISVDSANVRTNVPMSTTESRYTADVDYLIANRTILRGIVERKHAEQTLADRAETNADKFGLELRRPVSDEFLGSLGYTHTRRRGSDYDRQTYYRESYTNDTLPAQPRYLTNHPSMRRFMYGDYNEDRARTSGNWTVNETVNLQATADRFQQRHRTPGCNVVADPDLDAQLNPQLPDTCLGLTRAQGGSVNLDIQWQPDENITTFAFANYSLTESRQRGRTWARNDTSAPAVLPNESDTAADLNRDWFGTITYRDHSLGTGFKWQPQEKWDFGGTYVYSRGSGKFDIEQASALAYGTAGAVTASSPVPDTSSRLHTVQLFAKWDYSKAISWRLNYVYEILRSYDWAYDGVSATASSEVLLNGQTSAKYINHVVGVSVAIKSW